MRFEYFDMLCGDPLYLEGVGHLRSPKLKEICPNSHVGYKMYNLYLSFLSWDKEHLLKYDEFMKFRGASKLRKDALNVFDAVTLLKQTRELCRTVLSFFIVEEPFWDETKRRFLLLSREEEIPKVVGAVNRDNFEDVRRLILHLNYIGLDKDEAPVSHSDEATKNLWERAQQHLKEQAKLYTPKDRPEYHLSNIISKLCAAHPSYNLLNVYDLTIFQLYDAFFQLGFIRSSDLNERIFSNHGGKKFKFEDWLKPIFKKV